MSERWKPVRGYEGYYTVSSLGRVKRIAKARGARADTLLRPGQIGSGHLRVRLCRESREETFLVHRLVLSAFIGPCPPGQECRHLDGNPGNNHLLNLAWGTRSENITDRVRHGISNRGEHNGMSKLTASEVKRLRWLYSLGGVTQREIARWFGLAHVTVASIINRKRWAHV